MIDEPSIFMLAEQRGVRLSAKHRAVAVLFDETSEPICAVEVWSRLNARAGPVTQASVYRSLHRLLRFELIVPVGMLGRRLVYQKRTRPPAISILDLATNTTTLAEAPSLLIDHLQLFARTHGFELCGRVEIRAVKLEDKPADGPAPPGL